jgi:hypothetical protein
VTEEFTITITGIAEPVSFKAYGKVATGTAQLPAGGSPVAK